MTTTSIQGKVAESMAVSIKESLFLLVLLVPMTFGKSDIFLEVTDFSSSEIELSCRLEHDGNLTNLYFEAMKGSYSCLYSDMEKCESRNFNECGNIQCRGDPTLHPEILTLSVPLDGTCEETHNVRCIVKELDLQKSFKVTAQSNPPVISIGNIQHLEVNCEKREIVCTISDICYKTELHIFGDHVLIETVETTHKEKGDRFTATAKATAIFDTAGNYTIGCRESEKGYQYSRNLTFEVYPSQKATCAVKDQGEDVKDQGEDIAPWKSSTIALSTIMGIVLTAVAACVVWFVFKKVTAKNRSNRHESPEVAQSNGYRPIPLREIVNRERTIPEILKPQESVCGTWIEEDSNTGKEIAKYIRNTGRKVEEADMQNIQEAQNHAKYFAVITSNSLQNDQFIVYLRSVLWRMCSADRKLTVVFVIVGEDISNEQLEERFMINLQRFPIVKAPDELSADHLQEISKNLEGHQLSTEVPHGIENFGFILAWYYFHEYLVFILPGMMERIKRSKFSKELSNKRFIIMIPESCTTPAQLNETDTKFSSDERLDDGINIQRPPCSPFRSNITVHRISKNENEDCLFCGEYAIPISALKEAEGSGKLAEGEMKEQLHQFTETLKSILQSHPSCRDKAVVFAFKDDTTPADNLFDKIKNLDQQGPSDVVKPVTKVAEGLVQSYFHLNLKVIGPSIAKTIRPTSYYDSRKMATKLFILLPHSGYGFHDLKVFDKLEMETVIGGNRLRCDTTVFKVSDGQETYYACVDYCTPVMVMYEMEKKGDQAGLSPMQIAAEVRVFYEILYDMLYGSSAPEYCQYFELVYFNGDKATSGKKLSDVLVEKIKQSLKEEFHDYLGESTNDRQSLEEITYQREAIV